MDFFESIYKSYFEGDILLSRLPKGLYACAEPDYKKIASKCVKEIDHQPNNYELKLLFGFVQERLARHQESINSYKSVSDGSGNVKLSAIAYNNIGIIASKFKRFGKAFEMFAKAVELDKESTIFRYNYDKISGLGPLKQLQAMKNVIKENPGNIDAHNLLGLCYVQIGDVESARHVFEIANGLFPNDFTVTFNYAYTLHLCKEDEASANLFNSIVEQYRG